MRDLKKMKIIITLGPSSLKKNIVENMDTSGVDLFRINLSHTKTESLSKVIKNIQGWTEKPVCLDTQGAQIRTGQMKKNKVFLKTNDSIFIISSKRKGDRFNLPLYPIEPEKVLEVGDILYIDFNKVIVQITRIEKGKVEGKVLLGGQVGLNKAVHMNRIINLLPFTVKDLEAFRIARRHGISFFALSFASNKESVGQLRKLFPYKIFVISKIENRLGLANLEEICEVSDAILIDRGDLSREVPLQKIGLAQKHILEVAKKKKTPLYVATNILESMMESFEPTRAEVSDITNALLSGAKGLVLAAETAIGKYPLESVRMVFGIIKEVERAEKQKKEDFLKTIYDYNLVEPHGGVLVQNFLIESEIKDFKKLPKIKVEETILLDAFQIAEGLYSPIKGFMNEKELISVLENYKLPNGVIWPLPIIFQLFKKAISFKKGDRVILKGRQDKESSVLLKVANIQKIDRKKIAKKWFGTDDLQHPGVNRFFKMGDYIISGEVFLIRKSSFYRQFYTFTPKETREIFKQQGWQKIVGFHTRNVIHRGHEFLQKEALESVKADALFISPVIGPKKNTDFSPEAVLKAYEIMLQKNYYAPYPAFIGAFHTYSRYSGPREAVFTALCRKNFGCSHFIVGRDHTGVGNYYPPDASQKIFEKIGNIGMTILTFDAVYFCQACRKVTDKCSHSAQNRIEISGSSLRKYLIEGRDIPAYLARKDIVRMLQKMAKNEPNKLFVG